MTSNARHGSPPRLMAHQPTRFAAAQESRPSPSPGIRITRWLLRGAEKGAAFAGVQGPNLESFGTLLGAETTANLQAGLTSVYLWARLVRSRPEEAIPDHPSPPQGPWSLDPDNTRALRAARHTPTSLL